MLSVILTELGIGVFDNDKCVKSFPFSEPAEDYVFVKKGKSRLSDLSKFLIDEQKDVVVNDLALNDLLKKKDIDSQIMSNAKMEDIQLTKPTILVDAKFAFTRIAGLVNWMSSILAFDMICESITFFFNRSFNAKSLTTTSFCSLLKNLERSLNLDFPFFTKT